MHSVAIENTTFAGQIYQIQFANTVKTKESITMSMMQILIHMI